MKTLNEMSYAFEDTNMLYKLQDFWNMLLFVDIHEIRNQ